jgi:hypothetical protein
MAATRCGHTNMYNCFGKVIYGATGFAVEDWRIHHNPIVVLRNPLERVVSAFRVDDRERFFIAHSAPYMNNILTHSYFHIIDFYDLEQYIPRKGHQSPRTYSHADETVEVEDVYVQNSGYTLKELQQELEIYKELMMTRERVSVEEWKELTT